MKPRTRRRIIITLVCSCVLLGILLLGFEHTGHNEPRPIQHPRLVLQEKIKDVLNVGKIAVQEYLYNTEAPTSLAEQVKLQALDGSFESNFVVLDSERFNIPPKNNVPFVLVIPRRVIRSGEPMRFFNKSDVLASMMAGRILSSLSYLDGLACLPRSLKKKFPNEKSSNEHFKKMFSKTWCNFLKRDWSIQIRNSGTNKTYQFESSDDLNQHKDSSISMIQICNIANGPFILRKEKYMKLNGLRRDFGRATFLDFFVRSGGQLKIGKSADCFYSDELFQSDRGNLDGEGDFPEYSNFGAAHDVLRIIMEDRIEWTKCVATNRLCKEKPYTGPPTTLPRIAQPICCSDLLSQMLKDIVAVLDKLGIQYRVAFGTLLGGERSGAIVPYSRDIDFTLESKYGDNPDRYASLNKYFGDKYFISGHSFIDFPRMISLRPAYFNIKTAPFFKDEYDLEGDKFFSKGINQSVEAFLPFSPTDWTSRPYADFYRSARRFWEGSSTTIIDGNRYTTFKNKEGELLRYYGNGWRIPALRTFGSQSGKGSSPDTSID